jgi:hypothetical protein
MFHIKAVCVEQNTIALGEEGKIKIAGKKFVNKLPQRNN